MLQTHQFLLGISSIFMAAWIVGGFTIIYKRIYDEDITVVFFAMVSLLIVVMWSNFVLRITGL